MANLMGARGVWVRDGVVKDSSVVSGENLNSKCH